MADNKAEPTEDQRRAAHEFLLREFMPTQADIDGLAGLLAQRERLAMSKGAAIAWGSLWDSTAPADVIKVAEDVKSVHGALDIYVGNDEKADKLLRQAGLDDTVNVVPRLAALVDEVIALRTRNAELEGIITRSHRKMLDNVDGNGGTTMLPTGIYDAHLAHIKALRDFVTKFEHGAFNGLGDIARRKAKELIASGAHYDTKEQTDG